MTDPRLTAVLADLAALSARVDAMVSPLDAAGWRTATPAAGWDIAHQIAHLTWTDEVAVTAATDREGWEALLQRAAADPYGYVDTAAAEGAAAEHSALLERWRVARTVLAETLAAHPATEKIAWFGPPMSATSMATARFMETWAHGHDIADALGQDYPRDGGMRHVVHLGVRTRNFAFAVHGMEPPGEEFRVELTGPEGDAWAFGPEDARQVVRGSAYDFCLLVTQRRNRADLDLVAEGEDADRWLDIAQAFAGPPGDGRAPADTVAEGGP